MCPGSRPPTGYTAAKIFDENYSTHVMVLQRWLGAQYFTKNNTSISLLWAIRVKVMMCVGQYDLRISEKLQGSQVFYVSCWLLKLGDFSNHIYYHLLFLSLLHTAWLTCKFAPQINDSRMWLPGSLARPRK